MKGNTKEKFKDLIRKNGFYVALALAITVVGAIAFFAVWGGQKEETPHQSVQKQESPTLEQQLTATRKPSDPPAPTPGPTATPEKKPAAPTAPEKFTRPVEGEIIKAFSGDTLVYNATLNTWMTHNGIDLAAREEEPVLAALAGEVTEILQDETKGYVVTLTHSGGRMTRYMGLGTLSVEEGAKVNGGQQLGTAATPAFEQAEGVHLHFEYLTDDIYQDPVPLLDE